jgi:hypothetical protein
MQVTELQVQRSLQALTGPGSHEDPGVDADAPSARPRADGPDDPGTSTCPEGLVEHLSGTPAIRDDRLAAARRRLESGEQPSDEDVAQRMVGRLVCDRLR